MTDRPRILAVCTHNRTRSVMMAAMLGATLDRRVGEGAVVVESSGFVAEGWPAIDEAVAAMARRGLDVAGHTSRLTTAALVDAADLVVTAERDHVVRIAALSPGAFARTMTLPELLARSVTADGDTASGVRVWATSLTADRSAAAYLREPVVEVADPTGTTARAFEHAVVEIERRCTELGELVAAVLERG